MPNWAYADRLKQKHHLSHHRKVIRATRGIVANGRSFDAERGIVTLFHKDVIDLYAEAGVAVGRRAVGYTEGIGKGEWCGPVIGGVTGSF